MRRIVDGKRPRCKQNVALLLFSILLQKQQQQGGGSGERLLWFFSGLAWRQGTSFPESPPHTRPAASVALGRPRKNRPGSGSYCERNLISRIGGVRPCPRDPCQPR